MALTQAAVFSDAAYRYTLERANLVERKFDGVNYTEITKDDLFTPGGFGYSVVPMFTGSKLLGSGFFGIHAGGFPMTGNPTLPSCSAVRSHDWHAHGISPERHLWWSHIQPTATTWYWDCADLFVNACVAAGKEILWVLGPQTPTWASARPTENSAYGPKGMAAEPADINVWYAYCYALASRYRGKIKYYEVWNEYNAGGATPFYSGTTAAMAQLVITAASAIKTADPDAMIVGPSVTSIGTGVNGGGSVIGSLVPVYNTDLVGGGKVADLIDVIGVHLYPGNGAISNFKNIPLMAQRVREALGPLAGSKPLWDTECGLLTVPVLNNANGPRHMWRRLLLTAAADVQRIFFYDAYWGHGGFTLDHKGQTFQTYERFVELLRTKPIENVNVVNNEAVAITIGGFNYLI